MLNDKLNNKGLARKEIMVVILIMVGVFAVVLWEVVKFSNDESYRSFKRIWSDFGTQAARLRDENFNYEQIVFLEDLLRNEYVDEDTYDNPFSDTLCDHYETKMVMDGKSKLVGMKCGEYVIPLTSASASKVKIYKVDAWQDKFLEGDDIEEKSFYALTENGKEISGYYGEREFIDKFNDHMDTRYATLSQIKNAGYDIAIKTYYRHREFIREV